MYRFDIYIIDPTPNILLSGEIKVISQEYELIGTWDFYQMQGGWNFTFADGENVEISEQSWKMIREKLYSYIDGMNKKSETFFWGE